MRIFKQTVIMVSVFLSFLFFGALAWAAIDGIPAHYVRTFVGGLVFGLLTVSGFLLALDYIAGEDR